MSVTRPLTVGVTALLALGAAATGAAAQSEVDVSAAATSGSRQFFVEDLTGTTLTALDLGTSGQGQLFQTRVKDMDYTSTAADFTASAEMTNLYRTTGGVIDPNVMVPSEKVSVSYAALPTDVTGVSLAALPKIGVAGVLPVCSQLSAILPAGSELLDSGGLLGGALALLGLSDEAVPLCTALGGSTATLGVPVEEADKVIVPLAETILTPALDAVASLPVGLQASESGAFTAPSYLGVGGADTAKTGAAAATPRVVLQGQANDALDLASLISSTIDGAPLFPAVPGGEGAVTTVTAVVSALQSSLDPAVQSVGTALAGLTAQDQTAVLSALAPDSLPVATLVETVLNRISGTYRSFPRLTADLTGAATGKYTGTMTITFVQQ